MGNKSNNNLSQQEMILQHLREYGSITPRSAEDRYGIMRLGARIWDLRQKGYDIVTTNEKTKNRFGIDCEYARYFLRGEPNDES